LSQSNTPWILSALSVLSALVGKTRLEYKKFTPHFSCSYRLQLVWTRLDIFGASGLVLRTGLGCQNVGVPPSAMQRTRCIMYPMATECTGETSADGEFKKTVAMGADGVTLNMFNDQSVCT
jgi:hypothetical protein